MTLTFSPHGTEPSIPLYLLDPSQLETVLPTLGSLAASWAQTHGFKGSNGQVLVIPNEHGTIQAALVGFGSDSDRKRIRFTLGGARNKLPAGTYSLVTDMTGDALDTEYLGWLLSGYRYDSYAKNPAPKANLIAPENAPRLEAIAAGEALTRNLINTPTNDMSSADLAQAASDLAEQFGANVTAIVGDDLLTQNFPMIHTVGRASDTAPRLIDMRWGQTGPQLTLVGKGVCFDTGGLNLKPGASMGLMKKDMGGSAAVLGLAHMIMALDMPLRLRVLIPAVENSVSSNAFRPGDILNSRKGLTVEINNTDAEGRLVLADALALADEGPSDLIISMATLTGAARVAVGPDIAPYYTDVADHSAALESAAQRCADPVWRMPFHDPYETMIEPGIADLDNAPKGGFAGSITAALFLRRFVTNTPYMHFDIYGWQPSAANARPKGGVGQGTRALLEALPKVLSL